MADDSSPLAKLLSGTPAPKWDRDAALVAELAKQNGAFKTPRGYLPGWNSTGGDAATPINGRTR